jgi:hypothetical protein
MGSLSDTSKPRLILRFRGKGTAPLRDAQAVIRRQGLRVVDESPRMLLLEAGTSKKATDDLRLALPEWIVSEEIRYALPNPPPKVSRPA